LSTVTSLISASPAKLIPDSSEQVDLETQMVTDGPAFSVFSASGEEAITRTIEFAAEPTTQDIVSSDLVETYEIERTATAIIEGNFKRVRLIYFTSRILY